MKYLHLINGVMICSVCAALSSCATYGGGGNYYYSEPQMQQEPLRWDPGTDFSQRLPQAMDTHGKKTIVVDPSRHVWGAYTADGSLVRAGIATSGGSWCDDTKRPCYTSVGTFNIRSLGGPECKSSIYPKPHGGGLMPYCMFFHGSMSLHGSPDHLLAEDNLSHGCVRMRIQDAEWVRYNFADIGTKVVVKPYI